MGNVLKSRGYRLVSNSSFELPLPLKYELYREDSLVAEYEVSDEENVSCRILTKYKEEMLTPVQRPIGIADIYYFLSSRVFQDNTPFTYGELALLGLEKYNVYDILRKTRGITPYDKYWLKFSDDDCSGYDEALSVFNELMTPKNIPAPVAPVDYGAPAIAEAYEAPAPENTYAEETPAEVQPVAEPVSVSEPAAVSESSGASESSGGNMSQDDIAALLAMAESQFASELETPAEPAAPASSGGTMSQDDIEKMLAAATAEPAPEPEAPASSGGMMSEDEIAKLLAAATAPEPEPVPETSGGKMSQDDIEKMLAAASAEPAPE
ncbi:MAG: hypothetical protein J1F04_02620, partial [Oscillospiraceae bacterium]|nr:hypothetical protein [Oscillospiraceae bacterium]